MPIFPAYKHWIELIPTEGVIVFRLYTQDTNTNILVTEDYTIPNPPLDFTGGIHKYIDENFDMVAAQDRNVARLQQ
jgi:hypothetical protein